jgi:hypothetical protein
MSASHPVAGLYVGQGDGEERHREYDEEEIEHGRILAERDASRP